MKKWVSILLAAMLVLLYGVFAVGSTGDDTDVSVGENQDSENSTVTTANKETTVRVGEVLTADGLEVKFLAAEDYTSYEKYFAPDEGNKIVRMQVEITNKSDSDQSVGSADFSCYADNQAVESYLYGENALSIIDTISSGRSTKGYVYFEVPADAQSIEVEFEVDFWRDKKAVFIIK